MLTAYGMPNIIFRCIKIIANRWIYDHIIVAWLHLGITITISISIRITISIAGVSIILVIIILKRSHYSRIINSGSICSKYTPGHFHTIHCIDCQCSLIDMSLGVFYLISYTIIASRQVYLLISIAIITITVKHNVTAIKTNIFVGIRW